MQTPAQLSAAEPPATLRSEQSSADLTLAEGGKRRGGGASEAGVFNFHSRLCGRTEVKLFEIISQFLHFREANVIIVPGPFVHSTPAYFLL